MSTMKVSFEVPAGATPAEISRHVRESLASWERAASKGTRK